MTLGGRGCARRRHATIDRSPHHPLLKIYYLVFRKLISLCMRSKPKHVTRCNLSSHLNHELNHQHNYVMRFFSLYGPLQHEV
jgi:hypothetical protein